MMFGWDGWSGCDGSAMAVMSVAWIVLLALAGWALVRLLRPAGATRDGESPMDVLDRRLASGAIDAETYDSLRDRLGGRSRR